MSRILFVSVGLMILLSACTQRMICPAYQSSFIYDKETLRKKFSYFEEGDSVPKLFSASTSKNRYLVAVPESYRKKMRSLQTVEMKPIYPQIPDSLKEANEFDLAERDLNDSSAVPSDSTATENLSPADSAYAITKTKEKYNVEQDNYMWYFRNVLVLPDVRAAMEEGKNKKEEQAAKEKKGVFGFFKNLFKKKSKDSTAVSSPSFDQGTSATFVDSTASSKPKGGLFKKKEKKPKEPKVKKPREKKVKEPDPKKKEDDKKKEDEDDGFE